jgi:flagellar protein FliO/FliZ
MFPFVDRHADCREPSGPRPAKSGRPGFRPALGVARLASLLWLSATVAPLAPAADKPADKPAVDASAVIYPRTTSDARAETNDSRGLGYTGVLVTALVLAAAGGWLFWRGRSGPGAGGAARKLNLAETKSLGNRQYLVVATYEDRKFLLGVCPGRIELLTALDDAPRTKSP